MEDKVMANKQKIRIKLKAYDYQLLDQASQKIVDTARRTDAIVSGPIPLPTEKEVVTILRAPHKYKDAREQFEMRTHKRLIDVLMPSPTTADALLRLDLPAGVDSEIKMLLLVTGPFNLIKGVVLSVITAIIYKPLSPFLHSKR